MNKQSFVEKIMTEASDLISDNIITVEDEDQFLSELRKELNLLSISEMEIYFD